MNEPHMKLVVMPPVGCYFASCKECENPMVTDGTHDTCLWCQLHMVPDLELHEKQDTNGIQSAYVGMAIILCLYSCDYRTGYSNQSNRHARVFNYTFCLENSIFVGRMVYSQGVFKMRLFYWLIAKFRAWNYKRKYGIPIEEGVREYGQFCVLKTEYPPNKNPNTVVFRRYK